MIFIYPASVSETCDKRIVPAVAKCIERFFLTQIMDAMSDNVIPLSRKYVGSNYGPILMECVNNYNKKQLVTENKILLEDIATAADFTYRVNDIIKDSHSRDLATLQGVVNKLSNLAHEIDNYRDGGPTDRDTLTGNEKDRLLRDIQREMSRVQNRIDQIERRSPDINGRTREDRQESRDEERLQLEKEKNQREWQKERRDDLLQRRKDARETNRDAREFEAYADERAGSGTGHYMPLDTKIDITPTVGSVWAPVYYKGGPRNGAIKDIELSIAVKVIPTIIKNFKVLEKDLLDDYFTKKSESYFKSKGRNAARHVYNALKRLPFGMGDAIWKHGMMAVAGDDVERESRKDIIYNSHGFVNASAFHKSSSSPNNYNFTSNIVIFNKDDLTDPDDSNIFQNRSAMVKLFKLGWSTFCMLDPVEEMMYFISSLDGGYMHPIPYRYIMESYGSRAYYGTEEKLKDAAKPFSIKRGNFSNFSKVFYKKRK